MDEDEEKPRNWFKDWWPILLAAGIGLLVVGLYLWSFESRLSQEQADWGQFGDYIGGALNPVVAAFALVLLTLSLQVQRRELALTRKELADTRKEMKASRFESQFFSTIALLAEATRTLRHGNASTEIRQTLTHGEHPIAAEFIHRCISTADRYSLECSPVISLVKVAADLLHRNAGALTNDELWSYARILRGFISEYEFCPLIGAISDMAGDMPLLERTEQFRLFEAVPTQYRRRIWHSQNRETTILNQLPHIRPIGD